MVQEERSVFTAQQITNQEYNLSKPSDWERLAQEGGQIFEIDAKKKYKKDLLSNFVESAGGGRVIST